MEKIHVSLKADKNEGYFTRIAIYIFVIYHSFLRRMRNVSDKIYGENQNTLFAFSNFSPKIVQFVGEFGKILYSGAGHR